MLRANPVLEMGYYALPENMTKQNLSVTLKIQEKCCDLGPLNDN